MCENGLYGEVYSDKQQQTNQQTMEYQPNNKPKVTNSKSIITYHPFILNTSSILCPYGQSFILIPPTVKNKYSLVVFVFSYSPYGLLFVLINFY